MKCEEEDDDIDASTMKHLTSDEEVGIHLMRKRKKNLIVRWLLLALRT